MTTLEAIGFTLAGGSCVFITSLVLFGVALKYRNNNIAPRCTARPRNVIYNPNASAKSKSKSEGINKDSEDTSDSSSSSSSSSQYRGNVFFGWILWALRITYPEMIEGVEGTGTRNDGLDGSKLKVNLDSIVLLRFHALCLKVSAVTTILCLALIMPLNLTARCFGDETSGYSYCLPERYNLTNYEKTTLANIPSLEVIDGESILPRDVLVRLYVIVFCLWFITYFSCVCIKREWIDILAIRRVYYLEEDVWSTRKEELQATLLNQVEDINDVDDVLIDRKPWIPHPEQRDTVPNIELYSILVGNLPQLPEMVFDNDSDVQTSIKLSKRQRIDWQLEVTKTFFDQSIPNQPGFTSSVAAVTILPSSTELANAWSKWYKYASALRRLIFIRRLITRLRYYDIDYESSDDSVNEDDGDNDEEPNDEEPYIKNFINSGDEYNGENIQFSKQKRNHSVRFEDQQLSDIESIICNSDETSQQQQQQHKGASKSPKNAYKESIQNLDYYKEVFSTFYCAASDEMLLANFSEQQGPEQTAVYSRELAQSAAACCPNGCCEGRLRRSGIDDLVLEERDAIIKVQDTYDELKAARIKAAAGAAESSTLITTAQSNDDKNYSGDGEDSRNEEQREKDYVIDYNLSGIEPPSTLETEFTTLQNRSSSTAPIQHNGKGGHSHNIRSNQISNNSSSEEPPFLGPMDVNTCSPIVDITGSGLRNRPHQGFDDHTGSERSSVTLSDRWSRVGAIVNQDEWKGIRKKKTRRKLHEGAWRIMTVSEIWSYIKETARRFKKWILNRKGKAIDEFARESTYAVVTFTSRHAAIEARKCLLDGRGQDRWFTEQRMPVPPLADASAWRICPCRGCSRPVTLTLPDKQKLVRQIVVILCLGTIYIFYTIPLTLAANAANPTNYEDIGTIWPWLQDFRVEHPQLYTMLSGLVPALIWTLFFATCPFLFKTIANFGSNSSSVVEAEHRSLQYFWWFMFITAFTGNLLATMVINGFNEGLKIGSEFQKVLESVAATIPTSVSSAWLNWIIVRFTMTLPLHYMLFINSFLFGCLRWKCCKRCVMGGGAGPSIPYRIFVDSGVVFMCLVALAPASPLVAPAAFVYYMYCNPLFRRNCIFVYRPKFDAGGIRWPFLSDILISSLMVSQILMCTMMFLKRATGPAITALIPLPPTVLFRLWMRKRFLRAFEDGALLQTSILDNWDDTRPASMEKREEFRRFLVDAHKAAYVPICIAGCEQVNKMGNTLTAEPAVTIPHINDSSELDAGDHMSHGDISSSTKPMRNTGDQDAVFPEDGVQYGASFNRVRCNTGDSSAGHISFNDDGTISTSIRQTEHLRKIHGLNSTRINRARIMSVDSDVL